MGEDFGSLPPVEIARNVEVIRAASCLSSLPWPREPETYSRTTASPNPLWSPLLSLSTIESELIRAARAPWLKLMRKGISRK
jgi:hypothetical protein